MNPANILIVEDETIVALDMKYQLQKLGYGVCGIFSTGEECLNRIKNLNPELVLMDIRLQGEIDGVEAAGVIREKYRIPVVFITAYADDETIERAKYIEPFGYIIKPFDERSLRTTIEMALYKHSMDKKLVESEERYRKFFEDDLAGDFIADGEGRILQCNSSFSVMFKIPASGGVTGMELGKLFFSETDRDEFWKDLKQKRRLTNKNLSLQTAGGDSIIVIANVMGDFDESGDIKEIRGYFIDNTERVRLEEQLRHAQKMEAIGRLAGGIAHDFNNILTVIIGYTTLMGEKLKEGLLIEEDIEGIRSAAKRASNLTRQLLIFSRRQIWSPRVVNLNHLVENMEKMIRRLIKENIRFQFFMDASRPFVNVDPSQMEQVIVNLAINARDAMPEGGKLIIKTETLSNLKFPDDLKNKDADGDYVLLEVSDSGEGIEQKNIEKIFDPFFTTKPYNQGTGLGLATVYGIVKQSEGFITVESTPGKGTSFFVYLPQRGQEEETVEPEPVPRTPALEGTETILLVEDEDSVRELVTQYLSRKGYRVLEARNAGEAIIQFEKNHGGINLVVTDIMLPLVKGDELVERLRRESGDFKVLYISGYPRNIPALEVASQSPGTGGIDGSDLSWFLQKPFEAEELLALIRMILDN